MTTTFLCWNLNRRPLQALVAKLAWSRNVDVLILVECNIEVTELLKSLNPPGAKRIFHYAPSRVPSETAIEIFTSFSCEFLQPIEEGRGLTIRHLKLPLRTDIILVAIHFRSKLHWRDSSQVLECPVLARTITNVEDRIGHSRTVVAGDFNMNPFEDGVVGAGGLNATMVRGQALKTSRTVRGTVYPFFYNPMWGHFGNGDEKPGGTYYYASDEHSTFYWNMYDQVLVRPDLVEQLPKDGVEIITQAAEVSLLTRNGLPNKSVASDHLPLLFRIGL